MEVSPMRGSAADRRPNLKMVAWELTRNCNLACVHCRASASMGPFSNELSTQECFDLLDGIVSFSSPVIILTGGEPLLRPDIFEIASYGNGQGLRMVMAVNGTLVNKTMAQRILDSNIKRISISLDGATAKTHDEFRKVEGAFQSALSGIKAAKAVGLDFQINTTITKRNLSELPELLKISQALEAKAHHIFLLVPTGRGEQLKDEEISAQEYEKTLNWFCAQSKQTSLELKATCAPHYYRILAQQKAKKTSGDVQPVPTAQKGAHPLHTVTRGCLGGTGFCFISHVGQVQPCGYLELDCGNIREEEFKTIWQDSDIFKELRDYSNYKGKCGICKYKEVCGGCRARAYAATDDYLEEEPYCLYQPRN